MNNVIPKNAGEMKMSHRLVFLFPHVKIFVSDISYFFAFLDADYDRLFRKAGRRR